MNELIMLILGIFLGYHIGRRKYERIARHRERKVTKILERGLSKRATGEKTEYALVLEISMHTALNELTDQGGLR